MIRIGWIALLSACALSAQTVPTPANPPAQPASLGFSPANIDRTANPCTDFYQYACGNWVKSNPIPADQSRWGRFAQLGEHNRDILHEILEAAAAPTSGRDATTQKIGDYYAACMDEKAIEAAGLKPIQPLLDRIRALKDKKELAAEIARLHRGGVAAAFSFGSDQDYKDSSQVIAAVDQGGLGLPDRDYYLKNDARSAEQRAKYVQHIARMFVLAGEKAEQAKADAAAVMRLETALAQGSLDVVSRRDPDKIYHRMARKDLARVAPAFSWNAYFAGTLAPEFSAVNVVWPDFFKALNTQIEKTSLADWKTYFIWQTLHAKSPLLPKAFVDESFDFYRRTLTGTEVERPRWKRCVDYTDQDLGEALGQKFVERAFAGSSKERTLAMVHALEQALSRDIDQLDWMTPATKTRAQEKLKAVANKIGYPDKWRDYSKLEVKRGDAVGNSTRAEEFEFARQLAKIGKPVDFGEWDMTPPTVNAYYNPLMNNINFPAGILQPPFFENSKDDAVNFGGIGMVIGHELTHGFDDEGRQFDAKGNLKDWWSEADTKEFDRRAACIVDEYSKFSVAQDANVNGKLTLGENAADNGGLRIALMALGSGASGPSIDGFTPEQRFFLSYGQIWCENTREEAARMQVKTNPHSPARFRVNGVVVNMPEFQKAFSCQANQPMVSQNACRVW